MMEMKLPCWIWHPERERRLKTVLKRQFYLDSAIENATLGIALTGSAKVIIDNLTILNLPESPENVCRFTYADVPPLAPGNHLVKIDICCQQPMPKHPAISFAYDRTVGCIAWIESNGFRLVTDESWLADEQSAVQVCKLGQEPYGDLDNAPLDFVRSGFGDLKAQNSPFELIKANNVLFRQSEDSLRLSGTLIGNPIQPLKHEQLIPIYHLRKQDDWKRLRELQKSIDMTWVPNALIDLKQEINARLIIRNLCPEPVTVLWNGAESLFELFNYDNCMTETIFAEPGKISHSVPSGLRYIALYVFGENGRKFTIDVRFESVLADIKQEGTFWCDDEELLKIYEVSAYTNKLCHQLALWDGIKRDRLPWALDLYLAARAGYVLWKDTSILKRSLFELARTPYGEWINSIPSYTLWWFVAIWEFIMNTSDADFVKDIAPYIQRHADWVSENIDDRGFLKVEKSFIDWVPMTDEDSLLSLQAIYAIARRSLQNISEVLPELNIKFNWTLPNINKERFLNSNAVITKVLGALSGYIDENDTINFLRNYELKDPISPCSAYLLACLYADFDMPDKGLSIIRNLWGRMLKLGATTFWETFRCEYPEDFHKHLTTFTAYGEYRISLCHSWSSTPAEWFLRILLGVNPIEPGYRKTEIAIWAPDWINKCEGSVPTPYGIIHVSWVRKSKDRIIVKTDIPAGIELI